MKRKIWTQEDVDKLCILIKTHSVSEVAEEFGVTYTSIVCKLQKLGIKAKSEKGETWTTAEDELLKKHFRFAPRDYLMTVLPKRTWASISQRGAKKFQIHRESQDFVYVDYEFFDKWTPESAYVFGFILADGYVSRSQETKHNKNVIQIEVNVKDTNIIYKIAAAMDFRGKLSHCRNSIKINCHNAHLIDALKEKGMPLEDKSRKAVIPDTIPKEYHRDFLRGLFDGDGWGSIETIKQGNKTYHQYMIGLCGTYDVVSKAKEMIPEDLSDIKISKSNGNYCYRFNIKGKRAINVANWLYEGASIFLNRKYKLYQDAKLLYDTCSVIRETV